MSTVDFTRIGHRMAEEMRKMLHEENWTGADPDRYAEALRRALGHQPDTEHGRDWLQRGEGLTTEVYAKYLYEGSAVIDRLNLQQAEQQVKEMRAEMRRVYREAGKDLANMLRERCNERSVPSRYRREGVTWAADLIDPTVPKDRYGNVVEGPSTGEVAA